MSDVLPILERMGKRRALRMLETLQVQQAPYMKKPAWQGFIRQLKQAAGLLPTEDSADPKVKAAIKAIMEHARIDRAEKQHRLVEARKAKGKVSAKAPAEEKA